jgi:hypothetical protein
MKNYVKFIIKQIIIMSYCMGEEEEKEEKVDEEEYNNTFKCGVDDVSL